MFTLRRLQKLPGIVRGFLRDPKLAYILELHKRTAREVYKLIFSLVVSGSGAGVEDEGVVYPLLWRACHRAEGAGQLGFGVLAGAGLVDPDGPVAGGALPAEAQDRGGLAVAGQAGRGVAVLAAVADEGLAEAGPACRDVGDDPPGDGVAGLLVRCLRHAVHDGRRGVRRPCPI